MSEVIVTRMLGGEPKGTARPMKRDPLDRVELSRAVAELKALPAPTDQEQAIVLLVEDVLARS